MLPPVPGRRSVFSRQFDASAAPRGRRVSDIFVGGRSPTRTQMLRWSPVRGARSPPPHPDPRRNPAQLPHRSLADHVLLCLSRLDERHARPAMLSAGAPGARIPAIGGTRARRVPRDAGTAADDAAGGAALGARPARRARRSSTSWSAASSCSEPRPGPSRESTVAAPPVARRDARSAADTTVGRAARAYICV